MVDDRVNPPHGMHESPSNVCDNVEQLMSEGHWRRLPKSAKTPSRAPMAPAALFFSQVGSQTDSMCEGVMNAARHALGLTGRMYIVWHAALHCVVAAGGGAVAAKS